MSLDSVSDTRHAGTGRESDSDIHPAVLNVCEYHRYAPGFTSLTMVLQTGRHSCKFCLNPAILSSRRSNDATSIHQLQQEWHPDQARD